MTEFRCGSCHQIRKIELFACNATGYNGASRKVCTICDKRKAEALARIRAQQRARA